MNAEATYVPESYRGGDVNPLVKKGEQFSVFLGGITEIVETKRPEEWYRLIMKYLTREKNEVGKYDQEVLDFIEEYIEDLFFILEEQVATPFEVGDDPEKHKRISLDMQMVAHKVAFLLSPDTPESHERIGVNSVTMEELLRDTDHFQFETHEQKGGQFSVLKVRANDKSPWNDFPLPPNDSMFHKGGVPRVVLKLYMGSSGQTIQAELPPNDFDLIAIGDEHQAKVVAENLGVGAEGVEMVHDLDWEHLCSARDIDLNQCFLGRNGLIYSTKAEVAAKTGLIHLESNEERLYGTDSLFYEGVKLAKNRGMYRLMKFVIEGKAKEFEFSPLNEQIDFGIYWLVLARKFAQKEQGGDFLNKLYYIAKKMGQVRPNEDTIYDVLDRVHSECPFFNFEAKLDQIGLARWLNRKLIKFAQKKFNQKNRVPSGLMLERSEGDTEPYIVSLSGFKEATPTPDVAKQNWGDYLERCEERHAQDRANQLIKNSV